MDQPFNKIHSVFSGFQFSHIKLSNEQVVGSTIEMTDLWPDVCCFRGFKDSLQHRPKQSSIKPKDKDMQVMDVEDSSLATTR